MQRAAAGCLESLGLHAGQYSGQARVCPHTGEFLTSLPLIPVHLLLLLLQYFQNDVAMEYLLNVLEQLNNRSPTSLALLDAQIKLIRVVANMSVNPEVGAGLGNVRSLGSVLLELLGKTSGELEKKKVSLWRE